MEEKSVAKKTTNDVTKWDAPLDLVHLSVNQVRFIAEAMANSGMFPDLQTDANKAIVKILAGQEIGVTPFQAMTGINIIQNKAAVGSGIIAAKVKGNLKYDYRVTSTSDSCTVTIRELSLDGKHYEEIGSFTYTMKDAERQGLAGKDNWKKFTANMLFARALTTAQRMFAPDALNGAVVYDPDELGAVTNNTGDIIEQQEGDKALTEALVAIESATDEDNLTDIVSNLDPTVQKNKSVVDAAGAKFRALSAVEAE